MNQGNSRRIISDIGPAGGRSPMPMKTPAKTTSISTKSSTQEEKIKVNIRPSTLNENNPSSVSLSEDTLETPKAINVSKDIPEDLIPKAGDLQLEDEGETPQISAGVEKKSELVDGKPHEETRVESNDKDTNLGSLVKSANAEMEADEQSPHPLHGYIYSPPNHQLGSATGVQPESNSAREALQSPKVFDTGTLHPPLSGNKATNSPIQTSQHIPKNRHIKAIVISIALGSVLLVIVYFVYSKKLL